MKTSFQIKRISRQDEYMPRLYKYGLHTKRVTQPIEQLFLKNQILYVQT